MKQKLEKVAVLGSGIMGSQIAAQLANVGVPSLLFDISQELAEKGLEAVKKVKPAAFYSPKSAGLITPLNYDDHIEALKEADWVIEVVVERLDIKKKLFSRIVPYLAQDAIISSNTSGLSVADMLEGLPEEFRKRFLVTHFFNPPRYMHLLEIIPSKDTLPEVIQAAVKIGEDLLGKGIVYGKDTPNFVANRIGVYSMMLALQLTKEMNLTVEEVDKLTGTIIGHAKSATFRTADLVGLDTLAHVADTAYQKCTTDERRDTFKIPPLLAAMVENKWLGAKTGKGFYQKAGKEILSLDLDKLEYTPQKKVRMDGYRVAKKQFTTRGKIHTLADSDDIAGKFIWELLSNTVIYAANRIPEIADDIVNIDNGMKWGFGWELGPFETWEAMGLEESLERMSSEGKKVPAWVGDMVKSGKKSFYRNQDSHITYYDIPAQKYTAWKENPRVVRLKPLKDAGKELLKNPGASLIDLGDGIGLLEFHSIVQPNFNPIDGYIMDLINEALEYLPEHGFKGMVIGHQGQHFSVGANIQLILKYTEEKDWQMLDKLSKTFQDTAQHIRFAPIPVVAAPFGMCLGGAYEISGACDRVVASAELYCGLVEAGVGIVPAGGGNLRLITRNIGAMEKGRPGPFPPLQKAFETIGFAKVSSSAKEAIFLGYFSKEDKVVINPDHLIHEAKQVALELAKEYQPPQMNREIYLAGEGGRLAIESTLDGMVKARQISPHDALIGRKLAWILTGGEKGSPYSPVDEQYILDLEREGFISLCGEPLTLQRLEHMMKTGKPLRN